jgi:hypothetical protein
MEFKGIGWTLLTPDRFQSLAVVNTVMNELSPPWNAENMFTSSVTVSFSKGT